MTEREIAKVIAPFYEQAHKGIARDVERLYDRFADKENRCLADAKATLTSKELRDLKPEDFGTLKGRTIGRLSRYELIQAQIDGHIVQLYTNVKGEASRYLAHIYDAGFDNAAEQINISFALVNTRAANVAALQDYSSFNFNYKVNGISPDDRLRHSTNVLRNQLRETLTSGLIAGDGVDITVRKLRKRMDAGASNTKRLVRTEMNKAYNIGAIAGYADSGVVEWFKFLATWDDRTSEQCAALDGEIFELKYAKAGVNIPPLHPNCRSCVCPVFPSAAEVAELREKQAAEMERIKNKKIENMPALYLPDKVEKQLNENTESKQAILNNPGILITDEKSFLQGIEDFKVHVEFMDEPYRSVYRLLAEDTEWKRDALIDAPFLYDLLNDRMVYNPAYFTDTRYYSNFVLSHEYAHRYDFWTVRARENDIFTDAIRNASETITCDIDKYRNLYSRLENPEPLFQDIISALSDNRISVEYGHRSWDEGKKAVEIFANLSYFRANQVDIPIFGGLLDEIVITFEKIFGKIPKGV
jgi:SPP1 gp7 family putative phage head morphogenesis protein